MTQFLIRRIFWAIFLFLVATIITYLIFWVIPSDPAALAAGKGATPADIARVSHFLHLDEPIWKQYLRFVWQLVRHGSLGQSFVNRQPVRTIIGKDVKKRSGVPEWDEAVLRAIDRTQVLPRDVDGRAPSSLLLVFNPRK